MGLGSTAKTLQTLADRAEQLYKQLKDVRARVIGLEESIAESNEKTDRMEAELERQRLLLEALAERQGIDVDALFAESAIEEAEAMGTEGVGEGTTATTDDDAAVADDPNE